MLFLLFVVLGAVAGLAMGGRLSNLTDLEWRGLPLLVLAALLNVSGGFFARYVSAVAPVISTVCLLVVFGIIGWVLWTTPGLWRPALAVLTLGALLNFLVMAANGGRMPVDLDKLRTAGKPKLARQIGEGRAFRHSPLTPQTPLGVLGDHLLLPRPFYLLSPGDILMAVGLMLLVWHGIRTPHRTSDGASPAAIEGERKG